MNMENLELNGARPDIMVPLTPENVVNEEDPQLDRAVRELFRKKIPPYPPLKRGGDILFPW
jgi:hypothetical protein